MKPTKQFSLNGSDGYPLQAYAWITPNKEKWKGVVQIVHGMAEHALRYGRFAKALNASGYLVYANDHRGHGKTIQNRQDTGFFADENGWSLVVEDVHNLNQTIKENHPSLPVFLMGHSMGSFISQQYAATYAANDSDKLSGVILSASIADAGFLRHIGLIVAKLERLRLGKRGRSKLLNAMSFGDFNKPFKPNRTEFDWLSRDTNEVNKYIADPLCGFMVSTQLWIDLLKGLGEIAKNTSRANVPNSLPLMLITGSDDPVTQQGKTVDALEHAYKNTGSESIVVKKYSKGRHESLNETNHPEVTADIISWLNQNV